MPLNNPEVGISNSAMAIANNNVTCSFTRTNEQSGVETYYNFKDSNVNNIYLLAAYGSGKLCLRKYDNILHNSFQCFFIFIISTLGTFDFHGDNRACIPWVKKW